MSAIISHPQNAMQAKAFTAPSSLSYGTGDITPPSSDVEGQKGQQNGDGSMQGQDAAAGNAPATPAATPGGGPGVSGIVPTLQ
jgi:transcription initiation factor TFIID TATA-box-binding protein